MGVSFKREDTMRFFQEIAFLLLPHLVVGQLLDLNRDEPIMDTSEKWECYVFGQCEEYSVNFEDIGSAESCHKFCGKNDDCKWWTWEPSNSLCSLFANCTDPKHSTGHPDAGPCSDCISGQQACPARECHSPDKCQGHVVEGPISHKATHLEDCINICKDTVDCEYYTYDKKDDHCVIFKNCNTTISCDTCATGKKYCSKGYHGDDNEVTEAVTKAVPKVVTEACPEKVYDDDLQPVCQEEYKCYGTRVDSMGTAKLNVNDCIWHCQGISSCNFYTWECGICHTYEDCGTKEPCSDCASGSMANCRMN